MPIFNWIRSISAALASGALLALCFPAFDLGFLVWISLVPLLVTLAEKRPAQGFLISSLCGLVFFPGIGQWLFEVPRYTLAHHAIWGIYLSLYFGAFGLFFSFISRSRGIGAALAAAPFLWVSLDFARSHMGFMSFPWGLLSHSQHQYPHIIQVAALTGNYGVTFLVVAVNAAVAALLLVFLRPVRRRNVPRLELTIWAAALLVSTLVYAYFVLQRPLKGDKVQVSLVQANIGQDKKWDPAYAGTIMETYEDLTGRAAAEKPNLIVWPEAATPRAINIDVQLYSRVREIAAQAGAHLLLGSTHQDKLRSKETGTVRYTNSAFLLSPDKSVRHQRYDKIDLLPFGEYLPMKGIIPWSFLGIPDPGSYVEGREFTIFECGRARFGTAICWETIFPDIARGFVRQGAQFLVNISNEAWFGRGAASHQFLSMNVLRAVENRVFVVRCANTGVSCFIDPYGRVVERVKDESGSEIFVQGILSGSVIPMDKKTIYTRYGDWFPWACILASAGFLAGAVSRKRFFSQKGHKKLA